VVLYGVPLMDGYGVEGDRPAGPRHGNGPVVTRG